MAPACPRAFNDETNPRSIGRGLVLARGALTFSPALGGAGGGSNKTELARCSE